MSEDDKRVKEIISFLKKDIEPIADFFTKKAYPCSVTLTDDVYLPCVLASNEEEHIKRTIKRLDETRKSKAEGLRYVDVLTAFIAHTNIASLLNVREVRVSKYHFPEKFRSQMWQAGETKMGWNQFVAHFKDRREVAYGFEVDCTFMDLPEGVAMSDILFIEPHKTLQGQQVLREKPFFHLYIPGL